MPDQYGVPDNVLGVVPEEFYSLVGRVALLAAWVDDRILVLFWALGSEPQSVHAGRNTADLARRIRAHLDAYDEDVRREGLEVLGRAEEALGQRHALLHSLWPNPTLEEAKGWRSIHPRRRTGDEWIEWTIVGEADLIGAIAALVDAAQGLDRFSQKVHFLRSTGGGGRG